MKRISAALVLCPVMLVAGFVGTARATPPTTEPIDTGFGFVDPTLCSFPVHAHVTYTGDLVTFYDRSGTPVRAQQRLHETDVFTAHGKTLVGQENTLQSITFSNGQPDTLTVHGLLFTHVRLPGGGIFLGSVGRVVLDINGNIVSFHGMPTTAPPAQHDAFCAALR
jgi:hypothetical protein